MRNLLGQRGAYKELLATILPCDCYPCLVMVLLTPLFSDGSQ